jgi:thiaminase
MAFSFNWAGVNIPQIQIKDTTQQAYTDAANLGSAVRGYQRMQANREYGDLIKNYREGNYSEKVIALKEELNRLKERNKEIAVQLGI